MDWYVYMVRTRLGTLYTGITTDVSRRLAQHAGEAPAGAKYLRSKGPLELAYHACIGTRAQALRIEHRLKRLSKSEKEELVRSAPSAAALLARLDP